MVGVSMHVVVPMLLATQDFLGMSQSDKERGSKDSWQRKIKRDGGKKIYGMITNEKEKGKGKGTRERSLEEI